MAKLPRLCEIIAVVSGKKGEVDKAVTEHYHKFQKRELFDGITRDYRPRTEDGEQLPSERKYAQLRAKDMIVEALQKWTELFNLTTTLDNGNCVAKGNIEIDGKVLVAGLPVSTLLFLEKQLANVHAFVSKLPTPDPSENWKYDKDQDLLRTDVRTTARTKKVQKTVVLLQPTEFQPGQAQLVTEDIIAGDWHQTLFTTAIPASDRNAILERISKLQDAVKVAREQANQVEVDQKKMADSLFTYAFGTYARK